MQRKHYIHLVKVVFGKLLTIGKKLNHLSHSGFEPPVSDMGSECDYDSATVSALVSVKSTYHTKTNPQYFQHVIFCI